MSTRPRVPGPSAPAPGKLALPELGEMKRRGDRITMLTAYDAPAALLADEAGVELVLVGDSAAMVMLGHESTVSVTLDEMIFLTRAVTRSARRPLVIGDLPFGSYEVSDEQAVASAIRMLKEGGADCVKLEGAGRMVSRVRAIAESNIGVMAHIGLTPQSATKLGGFRAQGRTADAALKLYDDALALQDAGCFALVLEAVPAPRSRRGSRRRSTSRRSASAPAPACDGQVLVWHDLLGLYAGQAPRFVKRYAGPLGGDRDRARGLCRRRARRLVPGGAAHLLDPRRRARAVRGGARRARLEEAGTRRRARWPALRSRPRAPSVQPWTARTPITSRQIDQARNPSQSSREHRPGRAAVVRRPRGRATSRRARASPATGRARARRAPPRRRVRGGCAGRSPASRADAP